MFARRILSVLLAVGFTGVSSAKQFHWLPNGSGNWADASRWQEGEAPGPVLTSCLAVGAAKRAALQCLGAVTDEGLELVKKGLLILVK